MVTKAFREGGKRAQVLAQDLKVPHQALPPMGPGARSSAPLGSPFSMGDMHLTTLPSNGSHRAAAQSFVKL